METSELLKKVRQIEIKSRGLSRNIFAGQYHSAFKGRGMAFSEVREYQFGDDVRDIDWNVTARHNKPFIKVFEEERELTVMLLIDVSASRNFGAVGESKKEMIKSSHYLKSTVILPIPPSKLIVLYPFPKILPSLCLIPSIVTDPIPLLTVI